MPCAEKDSIGNTTKPLTINRYEWTNVQDFEINTAGDQTNQIVLRYYPNQIVPNTGVYQEQYYIIQGVYITNDLQESIIKDGQVIKLQDITPPPLQGAGINYLEDASFETGQGRVGPYLTSLEELHRRELTNHVRAAYLSGMPDGPRSFSVIIRAVRGVVP